MKLGPQCPWINSISKICGKQENNSGIFTDMFYFDSNRCILSRLGSLQIWNLLFLLFVGGITAHKNVKVTVGTLYRNALIREARILTRIQGEKGLLYKGKVHVRFNLTAKEMSSSCPPLPLSVHHLPFQGLSGHAPPLLFLLSFSPNSIEVIP